MIKVKNYFTLDSITPKKVNEAIASGKSVRVEESHVDGYKTRYHRVAEIDGVVYEMSARGFNSVTRNNSGECYFEMHACGGTEGHKYN